VKRVLLVFLALLGVTAIVGAVFLSDASMERFLVRWLSAQMDREIRVDGRFTADLGIPLRLTAESVRLANPGWADKPDMATAELVEVAIDPWTILGDAPLIIEQLTLQKLAGELVSDEAGQANWHLGGDGSSGTNFLIRGLAVRDAALTIRRPGFDVVEFDIESLQQSEAEDGLLKTALTGQYNGRPVTAEGELGPFKNLLEGVNLQVALNASFGTLKIKGLGLVDDLSNPQQPKIKLDATAPNAVEVANMLGLLLDETKQNEPSVIQLSLEITPADVGVTIKGGGQWGSAELDVQGTAKDLGKLDGIDLRATGSGPNLRNSVRLFGVKGAPDQPFKFAGDLSRHGKALDVRELDFTIGSFLFRLTGNMNEFPTLNDADLSLVVKGKDVERFREVFGLPGVARGEFSLEAELTRGATGKEEFRVRARTELGKGLLYGSLGPAPDYVGTTASIRVDGSNFGHFAELLGVTGLKAQPFQLTADIEMLKDGYRLEKGAGLVVGDADLRFAGMLGADPLQAGTTLDWSLRGVDIADLARVARFPRAFPSRPLTAAGGAIIRPADVVFSDVEGTIGKSQFTLAGQVGRTESLRGTDARVTLTGPDLERLAFLVDDVNLPAGPFKLSGRIQRTAQGLRISNSSFDVAGAQGKIDGELALPADPLTAQFDVEAKGPNVAAFWEDRYSVELAPLPFVIDVQGKLSKDTWQVNQGLVTLGRTEIDINGTVTGNSGTLEITANSPELAELGTIKGIKVFPGRSLQLSGTLHRKDSVIRLDQFLARTNQGDLAGSVTYTPGTPPRLDAKLTSKALDVSWLTDPTGKKLLDEKPAHEAKERGDGRLIPDWTLPLDLLKRLNADMSLAADKVVRQRRDVQNLYIKLVVDDGALTVAPWRFGGDSGSLDAELRLTPVNQSAEVSLRLNAKNLVTGLFEPGTTDLSLVPKGDWELRLTSSGATVRELAANLNGNAQLSTSAGRMANSRRDMLLFGDLFGNIIDSVNPYYKKEPYTDITCAVFPFTFKNGVMTSAPSIVMQTDKLNILSRGKVNLRNEKLDLSFSTKPRGGIGISAGSIVNPFVRIGGTMAKPAITLDKTGALVTGGAAFFTAGLSLIAKAAFDAAWRSPDPCGKVLQESEKLFAKADANGSNK
jgi:uncharacterized protein involved in outer membrane biogenesis